MRYDIEGAWALLRTCNYRCDYCFLNERLLGEKIQTHATPAEWRAAFDATGKTWMVHLTGGEPTLYPDFAEIGALLAERHYLSLNSNLTGPSIVDFATRVDPARVSFINAGLHPMERARKQGHDAFLRHAHLLLECGFPIMVSVVATPAVLRDFEAIAASLRPIGLMPIPKLMQGKVGGRRYPDSYTAKERALFRRYSRRAEATYPELFKAAERPTIDPPIGRDFLDGLPDRRGQLCAAGMKYVRIEADGRVERCGDGPPLGNLLHGDVRFATEAAPCDRRHCFYVCERYSAPAQRQQETVAAGLVARMRHMAERFGVGA
ncbi:MAG TPA: radical SAM protein [Dongiaceae bacterium]|nr:radical SAM protein [Dongiaceae bacterium]